MMFKIIISLYFTAVLFCSTVAAQTTDNNYLITKNSFNTYTYQGEIMKFSNMENVFNQHPETSKIYQRNRNYTKLFYSSGICFLVTGAIAGSGALLLQQNNFAGLIIFYPSVLAALAAGGSTIIFGLLTIGKKSKLVEQFNDLQSKAYSHENPTLGINVSQNGLGLTLMF